ncbi:GFA family protein [Ferrimonas sp. SCSIO 43195]|uniref:GFA family protein n=1 Tax=Ferrimonas sp. SCSIO 43195 TaxID=2822844 RepID=UPI002076036A|nr:GFA family protein [Ferrimonas sp. SCSIO 43195]USD37438.1 GFA family protein [Ferrimonas sp. SCSIO 43195]
MSSTPSIARCSCGQLQAEVIGAPLRVSVCHCRACQRRSGNVFATQARFAEPQVKVSGTSSRYLRQADSGNEVAFHFCPRCGATVYFRLLALPGAIVIPVGAFADNDFPAPELSIYEARQYPWVRMPDDIDHHP